jgi:hypothetical protein
MDPLTFWERVIASLAWPLAVLALATIFRKSIDDVLGSISELRSKHLGLSAKLDRRLKQVKETPIEEPVDPPVLGERLLPAPKKPKTIEPSTPPPRSEYEGERVKRRRGRVGKAAMQGSWKRLTGALIDLAGEHHLAAKSPEVAVRLLHESGVVSGGFSSAFGKLKTSYKQLAAAPRWIVQSKLAEDFVESCERLTDYLNQL